MTQNNALIGRMVKESMVVIPSSLEKTFVTVLAINRNSEKNKIKNISLEKGIPIGGYLYDTTSKAYCVYCEDYLILGTIAASFFIAMKDMIWKIRIPAPEKVMVKYFNTNQKKDLKHFKSTYKSDQYYYEFVQIIDCC